MSSQPGTSKQQFFAGLDSLDQLADDSDDGAPATTSGDEEQSSASAAQSQISSIKRTSNRVQPLLFQPRNLLDSDPTRPNTSSAVSNPTSSIQLSPPVLRRTHSVGAAQRQRRSKKKDKEEILPEDQQIFRGLNFFFIPNKDDHPVRNRRINRAIAHGASRARVCTPEVTHVIIDRGLHIERASRDFPSQTLPVNIPIVHEGWLVESVERKNVLNPNQTRFHVPGMRSVYELKPEEQPLELDSRQQSENREADGVAEDHLVNATRQIQKLGLLDFEQFIDEDDNTNDLDVPKSIDTTPWGSLPDPDANSRFLCMSKNDGLSHSPNIRAVVILQQLAAHYDQKGDMWRTRAYRKAVTALRRETKLIRNAKEALTVKDIGPSIAEKIEEIETTGRLQKLEVAQASPEDRLLILFMGVYGAGLKQAQRWIAQGYRTLDDLSRSQDLTPNQRIGIEHYGDFQARVPREEVEEHANVVRQALCAADAGLVIEIGGSYRRGNADSGDIDILITKKDASMEHIYTLMTEAVIPQLTQQGFLKAEFAASHGRDVGSKWHGASALPGISAVWRRLDLLFVPWDELGAALIYFTGNDIFNRSMRLLASWKGMRLNQHGLYRDVMRGKGREKVTGGELLEGKSEKRIFELLGVPWRPPGHRKC